MEERIQDEWRKERAKAWSVEIPAHSSGCAALTSWGEKQWATKSGGPCSWRLDLLHLQHSGIEGRTKHQGISWFPL